MSFEATAWARKQKTGGSGTKLVLLMLADRAGTDFSCWPSVETLAEECEMGESTVRAATRALCEQGLIRVFYRRRKGSHLSRSNRYQLLIDGPDTIEPDADDWGRQRQSPAAATDRQDPAVDTDRQDSAVDDRQISAVGDRQISADIPITEPLALEPPALNPGAARNGEVMTGEIIAADGALFAPPVGAALDVAPNAGQITRRWINYCAEKNVKLTGSVIKRYAATVRKALADGFDDALIRRALAAMLADRVVSRPALLDAYLIRAQQGPELPPARLTAHQADAERRAAAAGTTAAARLYDTLTREA